MNSARLLPAATLAFALACSPAAIADAPVPSYQFNPATGVLTLSLPANPQEHYPLLRTTDFQHFTNINMAPGNPAPVWACSVTVRPPRPGCAARRCR